MVNILVTVFVFILIICLWVVIYDTNRFVVVRHTIADKRICKSCRAVVIADLHNKQYGKDNELLLQAIDEEKPNLILIAGDVLNAIPGRRLDTAIHFMKALAEKYPVYYGNGNHEHRLKLYPETYGDMGKRYLEALEEIGIHPLVNERVNLPEYGIDIMGSEIDRFYYNRFGVKPMEEAYLEELLGQPNQEAYQLLLAHNPDYFPQYAAWGADLVLSGHVHGGMMRIPFWGKGIVSPNVRLFPKYDGGLFEIGKSKMLVSRGLGMHTIPVRFYNPGELLVIDFEVQ